MASQRGNFTNPGSKKAAPYSGSSFEKVVDSLNLSPDQYRSSAELREWVLRNKDEKYVPPELLKAFGFQVDLKS
jgi:hypothetical protein